MTQDRIMEYTDFADFYNNPVIKQIAVNRRWTVSTTKEIVDKNGKKKSKMPIDMYELIHNERIWGCAWNRGHHPLVDLQTVCDVLPTARNNAYMLDANEDGFVVLDVEGRCPEFMKKEFLKLPYLYGEISMSGHGLHLIFELPKDILAKYPNAMTKSSLQSKSKDYEVLMADHFVTFTRNTLPPASGERTVKDFENIFEALCRIQRKSVQADSISVTDIDTSSIADFDKIMNYLRKKQYNKTITDFEYENKTGYDHSAYEHYASRFYYTSLKRLLNNPAYAGKEYTDDEKAIIIYSIAKEKIPYREKHDETRAGMPWLMFLVTRMIAKTDKQDEEWEKTQRQKKYETEEEKQARLAKEQEEIENRKRIDERYNILSEKEENDMLNENERKELAKLRKEYGLG